jgi:hypothetical protein
MSINQNQIGFEKIKPSQLKAKLIVPSPEFLIESALSERPLSHGFRRIYLSANIREKQINMVLNLNRDCGGYPWGKNKDQKSRDCPFKWSYYFLLNFHFTAGGGFRKNGFSRENYERRTARKYICRATSR